MGSHLFKSSAIKPQIQMEGGSRLEVSKANFPALQGVSFAKLVIEPHFAREPHWHANADELGYCLSGRALVTFYGNYNVREVFLIAPGDVFFIPSGALHGIEAVGDQKVELALQFSHEQQEEFGLSGTFGMFSDAVLANTWQSAVFQNLPRSTKNAFIVKREGVVSVPIEAQYPSSYRYALSQSSPLVTTSYGSARVARQNVWPILQRQALYYLELTGGGMREPHWHPETAEMGFVTKGKGRMSIQSPDGGVDTYEMSPGDLYFIPKAYPHHIECLSDILDILIFFDQPMPGDIGFTGSVKAFSAPLLAGTLHTSSEFFENLPTYFSDLLIVKKMT